MADIKFIPKARNANAIPEEPFSNGSLIAATDTGELYVDYNGARMRIGDVITLETEAQRIATLAPLPKLYYVTETGKLWRFADDWVCVNPDAIEADTVKAYIVQAGRSYYNVATINHSGNAYEIIIKTRIPVANQAWMPVVYIHGHTARNMVDLALTFYYNSGLTWATFTNKGTWLPTIKYFTYTAKDNKDYIGIALIGTSYYGKYQVDLSDIWNTTRNYSEGWTIEYNTNQDTTIVPTTNLVEAEQYRIATGIIGSASSLFTPRTIALTGGVTGTATAFDGTGNIQIPVTSVNPNNLSSAVPISKGGTGATNASSARTALEAGYTIRRTITTTGAGWYRIAATTVSVGRNYTDVYIDASLAGRNSQIGLIAAVTYGSSTTEPTAIQLTQKACVEQYKDGVTKARIVYVNGGYSSKYAYLEIYQAYDAAATYSIEFQNCRGWATRYDEPIAGEIPDGYSARELTFVHNAIVADKFVGDLTGTSTNSEQLDGVNADKYALKDYANQTFLPLTGGTLTGSLTANSFRGIVNPPSNKGSSFLNEPNTSAAAYIQELMADRLQFFPPANCLLETSSDGTSWATRSTPNAQKRQLLCCHPSYTARIDWAAGTQLRITFTADSYVFLSLLYLYLRTSGKIDVIIEQFRNASQDWVEVARQAQVTGQPIHVVLWHTVIRFQNSTNDMHSGKVRVTLIHTGTDTPILDQLRWKGGYPIANPYIYDWDPSRNVMFPAEVRASNFNGSWNDKAVASSFDENSTTTVPTCKQIADYVKSLIGG